MSHHRHDSQARCDWSLAGIPDRRTHGRRFVALERDSFKSIFSSYFPLDDEQHIQYLRKALSEAEKCTPSPTAFCVGCVLVTRYYPSSNANAEQQPQPVILATGYSRELPGNTHAEANALTKARDLSPEQLSELFPTTSAQAGGGGGGGSSNKPTIDDVLKYTDVYTTLEPCSVRTSGLSPCADALVASKVPRCFIGVGEPEDFVQCEGAQKLKEAGCKVIWVKGLEEECLAAARRGRQE
jgi:pyrimidine deaminase RibD-like protein